MIHDPVNSTFNSAIFRMIVVPPNVFDSKSKFLEGTRKAFGGGKFNLQDVSTSDFEKYSAFLKEEYNGSPAREFFLANCVGLQNNQYWCFLRGVRHSCIFVMFWLHFKNECKCLMTASLRLPNTEKQMKALRLLWPCAVFYCFKVFVNPHQI